MVFQVIKGTATDESGSANAGALITVFRGGTAGKVTIFSDRAGTQELDNPFVVDSLGRFEFFVPRGEYDVHIVAGARTYLLRRQYPLTHEEVTLPADSWDSPLEERLGRMEANIAELFEMVMGDTIAEPPG